MFLETIEAGGEQVPRFRYLGGGVTAHGTTGRNRHATIAERKRPCPLLRTIPLMRSSRSTVYSALLRSITRIAALAMENKICAPLPFTGRCGVLDLLYTCGTVVMFCPTKVPCPWSQAAAHGVNTVLQHTLGAFFVHCMGLVEGRRARDSHQLAPDPLTLSPARWGL